MKYFTRSWTKGEHTDEQFEAVVLDYNRHLDEIAARLPTDLLAITRISLNDALFKSVTHDEAAGRLGLRLRAGELQAGYFDLFLTYEGATVFDKTPNGLENLVDAPGSEVLYDEVDELGLGRFEHRMILWPDGEFAVQCLGFSLARVDVPSRDAP